MIIRYYKSGPPDSGIVASASVPFSLSRRAQVDAGEDQSKLSRAQFDGLGVAADRRELERAGLEPLEVGITMPSFLCRYTNSAAATLLPATSRAVPLLSCGTSLGNDQLGVPSGDPGVLPFRQLSQSTKLVLVGPDDQVLSRRRAARVDPPLLDPVVDLLRDDAELPSQVGNPPFVLADEVVAKQFSDQAQITHQDLDPVTP